MDGFSMTPRWFLHDIIHSVLTLFYPKDRKKPKKIHDHLIKQQAVATQIPNQFKRKLETMSI